MVHMYHYQDAKLNSTWHNPPAASLKHFPCMFSENSLFGSMAGYSFSRLCAPHSAFGLLLPLCSHVRILFLSQSLMFTSLLFLLLHFIYATDVPSPEDVKLAALCNPLGFPGYGIYLFTFLSCIYSSIVMI